MVDKRALHILLECFLALCFVLINLTSCHNLLVVADLDEKCLGSFFPKKEKWVKTFWDCAPQEEMLLAWYKIRHATIFLDLGI